MTAFDDLMAFQRETEALSQVAGRLHWDQETMMPRGAAEQRGEELAAMEGCCTPAAPIRAWATGSKPPSPPDETGAAQLRHIRRDYDRNVKVPARLAAEIARVTSIGARRLGRCQDDRGFRRLRADAEGDRDAAAGGGGGAGGGWRSLRRAPERLRARHDGCADRGDVRRAAPRPRVPARAHPRIGPPPPGHRGGVRRGGAAAAVARTGAGLRLRLVHGRIDKAVHPFSSGSGLDVRITTRTNPRDPFNCFYSTIHEVGHAAYEQGIDRAYLLTPLGRGASMGVHESQSRIYENQIGRSRAFTAFLWNRMIATFDDFGVPDAETFYAIVNRVQPGFIRTEADEVHYNLHILMRFDLERALIEGLLEVDDLPEAWNARFEADFGVAVDKPSHGVLQDVHWSAGLFGYFPTYTLGNVYAGCLHEALRAAVPDLDAHLAEGDTAPATAWLGETLQRYGGLREPRETIAAATGREPGVGPLLSYLEAKFGALYGV
jgi:carboxypeptidase Taq